MHASTVASSSIHRQHSASSAKASNSREATIAVVRDASSASGSASAASIPRVTMAPLLLKPAVQSCLKNGYRLSLPFAASMPYPSPSILFPSVLEVPSTAADTSAGHALAELSRSIRVLEDGRRASDPDVKSEFEAALFAWVDQESTQASMGLALGAAKDDDDRSLVDDAGLDGYGADIEDSPYLGAEQYARGSRIHNGMNLHAKARALRRRDADDTVALGSSIPIQAVEAPSVVTNAAATPPAHKEPRFSLTTDNIPRVGSPTELIASAAPVHPCDQAHGLAVDGKVWQGSSASAYSSSSMLKVPTIVLPQDSPLLTTRPRGATLPIVRTPYAFPSRGEAQAAPAEPEATVPRAREDPFASLNPFALEVKRTVPRPRSKSGPPSGPMCPRMPLMPQPSATSGSLTRLQARRPPALRLTNLPPAGAWAKAEIKANGKALVGRDMTVRPVYDPRLHGPVPLSAPPFTTPKSKQSANPGSEESNRRASTSSKKTELPSKLKLRGRAATDAKQLDLGLGLGITNVPSGGFPHPLPYRGVNAPEHTLSGSSDAASAVRREKMAAEKTRKHRGRFETLLAELTKPFDGRKRKASADAAALLEAAAVAAAAAKLATPPPAMPVLASSARDAMSAWAKRTFEATTAKGKSAGKIDSPPSAFLASAPIMEPTPTTPIVVIAPAELERETKPKPQLALDKPVPALPEIVIQEEIKLALPALMLPAHASPALSVRTGLRRDARNIVVAPASCAITLNSGTTMSEMENSPLVPANAVPTAQRARRDAQGASVTAGSRPAALAPPAEKVERPRTGGAGEPPSPRRLAFGVLARQRAPCDTESRRAVSYGGMQRPRGPRRQSSQCRRAVSSNLRCATSMSRQGSQASVHSSSPMLREGSESSFGSFNGCSPRAKTREFDGQPKKANGTPLLIDCSSPLLSVTSARRNGDIAQMLGSRSPLTRICDEAKGLMGLSLASADTEDAKLLAFSGTAGSRSQASKENAPNSRAASVLSSPRQFEDGEDAPFISALASPAGGASLATPSSAGGLVRQRLLRHQRPQTPLDMLRSSRAASAAFSSASNVDEASVDVASELQAVLEGQTPSAALLAIALAAEALCERDSDSISCFSGSTAVEGEALLPPLLQSTA